MSDSIEKKVDILPPSVISDDLLIYELDERLEFGLIALDLFATDPSKPNQPASNTGCQAGCNAYKC